MNTSLMNTTCTHANGQLTRRGMRADMRAAPHVDMGVHICIWPCMDTRAGTHVNARIHMHAYAHAYAHPYAHPFTCITNMP